MKRASGVALAAAMVLSVTVASPVFAAKKEKAEKATPPQVSAAFVAAIKPIEALVAAKSFPDAQAKLEAAVPLAVSADEKFYVGTTRFGIAQGLNDSKMLRQSLVEMLDSGSALMKNAGVVGLNAGVLAYQAGDYPDAVKRLTAAEQIGGLKPENFVVLADSYFKQNQIPAGLSASQRGVAAAAAAGVAPDLGLLARARDAAYRAKMIPEMSDWSRQIAKAMPSKAAMHDMVGFYLNAAKPDEAARIDLFRLLVDSKSAVEGREYRELAETLFTAKFPVEAKAVLDAGVASGLLTAQNQQVSDLYSRIAPLLGPDKASLSQADSSSKGSPTGRIPSRWADAFLGYGNNAKAIELYRMALDKGQVDADVINTRLGIALARSGQKAEALTTLSKVGGTRTEIGRFWKLWVESQP